MEDQRLTFLRMNEVSEGLSEAALADIASQMELVEYETGELIQNPEDLPDSIALVVRGRLKHSALDLHGNVFLERIYSRGDMYGGLTAALAEPLPIRVVSIGPSTLLTLDYQVGMKLTFKYPQLRENLVRQTAQNIKKVVFGDKQRRQPTLIAVYHESPDSRRLTQKLIRRLQELGESPCLFTDRPETLETEGIRWRSLIENGQAVPYEEIRLQIQQWSDSKRVFLDLSPDSHCIALPDVFLFSELVFWCMKPKDWSAAKENLAKIRSLSDAWREKVAVVWLLENPDDRIPFDQEFNRLALEDYKVSFESPRPNESRILANGVERLVHLLRGIRIGVALGGGAARGMAHLGVLKALEEQGIVVDMIAGTSAGAMTGIVLASGLGHDYATQSFVNDLTPSGTFKYLPKGNQLFLLYKYRRGQFDPMLREYMGDVRLEQLMVPTHTVTVDLVSAEPVVRSEGDAVLAILESINLPVLSVPILREGRALVDGGLINNVPADVLVEHGCNFVIAVSVTAKLESRFGRNSPEMSTQEMRSPSTLQTILRSYVVQNNNMNSIGVQPADVVIEPDVTSFDLTEFSRADELAEIGYRTTLNELPRIKELLERLDSKLSGS